MIHYEKCPSCESTDIEHVISVKDYSVSGKTFPIWNCRSCFLRFTQDIPEMAEMPVYYQFDDYISHTETKSGLVNQLYHLVRQFTLKQKKNLIEKVTRKREGNILDIGCGTGAFLETMQSAGWKTLGLEPDAAAREKAISRHIKVLSSAHLFELDQTFEAITMWHVLEHVHDLHAYLRQIHSLLSNEGSFIVAVPNHTAKDQLAYQQYWAAYDVPRHLYHFSPASLESIMKKHGFRLVKTLPMWFDSFYVSMLSEKYRSGRINYLFAFLNGLQSNASALFDSKKCSSVIYVLQKDVR